MATVQHSLSPANHYDADSYADFLAARAASVAPGDGPITPDEAPADPWDVECDPALWPDDTDADRWEPNAGPFDPEDAAAYAAWLDGDTPDREWYADQLALLEGQRPDCVRMPETLAYLDTQIASTRRYLILSEVAEFIAATRVD